MGKDFSWTQVNSTLNRIKNMQTTSTYPYISKGTTTLIKAVAILLIIIGHNHLICPNEPPSMRYSFLYLFHVKVFFILPFFYRPKVKQESLKKQAVTIIVRMMVPFALIYTFCFFVSGIIKGNSFDAILYLQGFFQCGKSVGEGCGFQFPWFLPAFMTISLIRLFSEKYKWLQMTCLTIGLSMFFYNLPIQPFEVHMAFKMYFIGFLSFACYKMWGKTFLHFGTIVFLFFTVLFFTNLNSGSGDAFYNIVIMMPIAGFCVLALTPPIYKN